MQNVLIATDLSKNSEYVLKRAIKLTLDTKAKLHILHVISTSHMTGNASDIYSARNEADSRIKSLVEAYTEQTGLDYSVYIESLGRIRDFIQDYARKLHADLIVIGSSHRMEDGFSSVLTRSEHVIVQAQRPVLVVRSSDISDYQDVFIAAREALEPLSMLRPVCKLGLAATITMTLPYHRSLVEEGFFACLINKWSLYKIRRARKRIETIFNRYGLDIRRLTIEDGESGVAPKPSVDLLVLPWQSSDLMKAEFDSSVRHILQEDTHDILFGESV